MTFTEPRPDLIRPNPGGSDDPLGESVFEPGAKWLRVFEPRDVRVVIGRGQDVEREVLVALAQADRVPIHRRVCGGGAVVLAPGMVVVAVRLRNEGPGVAAYFKLLADAIAAAVEDVAAVRPLALGCGDLAMPDAPSPRKVLGASLRQTGRLALYLGSLLIADQSALMERLLAPPSRQPDYRAGRGHGAFCTHLARWGVTVAAARDAVEARCRERLTAHA